MGLLGLSTIMMVGLVLFIIGVVLTVGFFIVKLAFKCVGKVLSLVFCLPAIVVLLVACGILFW